MSINKSNILFFLILIISTKSLIFGGGSFEVAAFVSSSVLFGFLVYLDHNEIDDPSDEFVRKLETYEKNNREVYNKLDAKVSSVLLSQSKPRVDGQKFGW